MLDVEISHGVWIVFAADMTKNKKIDSTKYEIQQPRNAYPRNVHQNIKKTNEKLTETGSNIGTYNPNFIFLGLVITEKQ